MLRDLGSSVVPPCWYRARCASDTAQRNRMSRVRRAQRKKGKAISSVPVWRSARQIAFFGLQANADPSAVGVDVDWEDLRQSPQPLLESAKENHAAESEASSGRGHEYLSRRIPVHALDDVSQRLVVEDQASTRPGCGCTRIRSYYGGHGAVVVITDLLAACYAYCR